MKEPEVFQEPATAPEEDGPDVPARGFRTGFEAELELGRLVAAPPIWALNRPDITGKLRSEPGRRRLALTGGIASGKSVVAEMFVALGARHIDFDLLARRAVAPGSPGLAAAVELLGPGFLTPDGGLDRPKTASAVFSQPGLKAGLEDIIHPLTWELMDAELDAHAGHPVVLISVPLLFEAGLETFFSPVITVFAPPVVQRERLLARNPRLTAGEVRAMIDSQWPAPPKVMGSTAVINNGGSLDETARQVKSIWQTLTK